MRWLIILIAILLTVYFMMPEPEPRPVEKTFIGPQVEPLKSFEGFEEDYLKADEARRKQLEEEIKQSGG